MPKGKPDDLRGKYFGRLLVVDKVPSGSDKSAHPRAFWKCICDPAAGGCGGEKITAGASLKSGHAQSCGCLQTEGRRKGGRVTSEKLSKGHGELYDLRRSVGLTQRELARKLNASRKAIHRAEEAGRYFKAGKLQIKARVRLPDAPDQTSGQRPFHCGYCGALVTRKIWHIRRNKSGMAFCNRFCSAIYQYHGPMPKESSAPFGSTVPAINPRIERAPQRRESEKWIGMNKVLEKSRQG